MKVVCINNGLGPGGVGGLILGETYEAIEHYLVNGDILYVIKHANYTLSYFASYFKKLEDIREEKLNELFKEY